MQQIEQYISGERDYIKLYGDTGPLVYPASHVYIFRFLYYLTNTGYNIELAQYIFIGLYLATLALVMQCYRRAGVPPYVFPLLVLSKRVHSIFLLRLFNDCFAVFFLFLAIYCYQRRMWTVGSVAYSLGLGVKMSLLLALPAVGIVLWQGMGRNRAVQQAMLMGQIQVGRIYIDGYFETNLYQIMLGYPFLAVNARSYLTRAFELNRRFLFKWTVNWRFIGEETFLSQNFARYLLAAHAMLLFMFMTARWLHAPLTGAIEHLISAPPPEIERKIARRVTPNFILTSILTAVIVGCLCARTLHYQFFVYIAWVTPFLLWRSGQSPFVIYAVWAVQEWAWNVYPSTIYSSLAVVACLKVTVIAILIGTEDDEPGAAPNSAVKAQDQKTE